MPDGNEYQKLFCDRIGFNKKKKIKNNEAYNLMLSVFELGTKVTIFNIIKYSYLLHNNFHPHYNFDQRAISFFGSKNFIRFNNMHKKQCISYKNNQNGYLNCLCEPSQLGIFLDKPQTQSLNPIPFKIRCV